MRTIAKKCLKKCLKNSKNIILFEQQIYDYIQKNDFSDEKYFEIIYNICGDILSKKKSLKTIFNEIKLCKFSFDASNFDEIRKENQEQDDFIENPFEVSEGVLQCKCGSNRTISYPLQTRSGDEKTSVYICCVQCGKKWVE